ncbi:shTK domain protein [Ancylostoma caninum]|uniref:ShTK domain protein n=1 Tax=Ancylostoma caninum TaxID=29170 RepID=A0A368FUN6_ANCCA|nr:shTK domain protein [Ancylostoma caninum]
MDIFPVPRTNCATVTAAQCADSTWRPILAEDCPNVCGFCLAGGCIDKAIQCANDPSICRQVDMQAFVKRLCSPPPATAASGVTVATTRAAGSSSGSCTGAVDGNVNCAAWARNGFCTNTFYPLATRKTNCAKTCNLC